MSAKPIKKPDPAVAALTAGVVALITGLLIYALSRDVAALAWVPDPLAALTTSPRKIPAAGQLPSLLHAYAFAMFAIAALGPWRAAILPVCSAWAAVVIVIELAQSSTVQMAPALRAYASVTTFDPLDLVAAAAGVALAAWHGTSLWTRTHYKEPIHAA